MVSATHVNVGCGRFAHVAEYADRQQAVQTRDAQQRLRRAANLCHVFWALAVILLAFASFTVIVVRLRHPASAADDPSEASPDAGQRIDHEQLRGFVYVGAGALALLAVAVILMGLFGNRTGRAEGLAVLGFFGYLAYLVAATLVLYVMGRKS